MDAPSADDVERIRSGYTGLPAALAGEDVDSYLEQIHPDVEWIPIMAVLEGRTYRGHEGVRKWLADLRDDWEVFEAVPDEIEYLGGGYWLVLGHWNARARGSGIELEGQPAAWIQHRTEGRLDRLQTFTDRGEALKTAESLRSQAG